jgi:hypothetical protein
MGLCQGYYEGLLMQIKDSILYNFPYYYGLATDDAPTRRHVN